MTPRLLLPLVVRPTLIWLGPYYATREAQVMLLAIAGQESGCKTRCQMDGGPARSWWQIEPPTAADIIQRWQPARLALFQLGLGDVHQWLEFSEVGACVVARGILALDPAPLPPVNAEDAAWACYIKNWRPGQPRRESWRSAYTAAVAEVAI